MEKTTENKQYSKLRNKFMKIATAAITVTFHNPPFSPGRSSSDHKFRSSSQGGGGGGTKGVGGVSMIPRTKHHKETQTTTQEPTSPKISCMGQIKHKKKHHQHMIPTTKPTRVVNNSTPTDTADQLKKQAGGGSTSNRFQRMNFFLRTRSARRKPDDVSLASAVGGDDRSAPPMGEMRRFASGREAFSNFNWKSSVEETDQREYCYSEAEEEDDIINEILIPFSAPINRGGATINYMPSNLRPRKEINLWKRRTMAPPRPLQVNPLLTAR